MQITLGLAQIDTKLGDVQTNLEKHLEYIELARRKNVDLLCFPELSLTGYSLQDLSYLLGNRPSLENPVFEPLYQASQDMDLVVGFVDEDVRHRYYIASAYLSGGKLVHVHHKVYLATYALFDEGRFFTHGSAPAAFDTRFGRMGMLICEDLWHASIPYLLWMDGAEVLLMMSASPGRGVDTSDRFGSAQWVERVIQAYASLFTTYVTHTNRVGYEDGFHFWGGSVVYNPDGSMATQGTYENEELVTTTIDMRDIQRLRARLPLLRDERPDLTLRTLERILKDK